MFVPFSKMAHITHIFQKLISLGLMCHLYVFELLLLAFSCMVQYNKYKGT